MTKKLKKSPLNQAVGRFLISLRTRQEWSEEKLASVIVGVSTAYLRLIEIGTRYLPPYAAVGLADAMNSDFIVLSGLLVLVAWLDIHEKDGGKESQFYDLEKILSEAERLKELAPFYRDLLTWLVGVLVEFRRSTNENESVVSEDDISIGAGLVRDCLSTKSAPVKRSAARAKTSDSYPLSAYNMSPVFEDLIDELATKLALFPPHMDVGSFAEWESVNGDRIIGIRGYVTDPNRLIQDVDEFDWSFLRKRHRPKIQILVSPTHSDVRDIQERLRERLRRQLRTRTRGQEDVAKNVEVLSSGSFDDKFKEALILDQRSMRRSTEKPAAARLQSGDSGGRYKRFNNGWTYTLEPQTRALLKSDPNRADPYLDHENVVGFLGDYAKDEHASLYVVVMDRADVVHWQRLFDDALTKRPGGTR